MKVSVVILNWNGSHHLKKFLPSVIANSEGAEVVVADNASTDESIEMLQREFPSVKQVRNSSNLGFAGGYNEALRKIDAEYYVLLNSDVEVTPGWISPVIQFMDKDIGIAACQPKILSYADRTSFEYAGAAGGFIDCYGYPFCRGRVFDTLEKDEGQYNDVRKIFWATGACLFVRAGSFRKVNGFDELFFAHMEEIDLCWRLLRGGESIWYCPGSVVYHVGGGTLHKSNPRKTYLNFRNNLLMLYKNLDEDQFRKIRRFRTVMDFVAAMKFLTGSGGWKETRAVIDAYRDFARMKEKTTRGSKNVSTAQEIDELTYPRSILLDYYFNGRKKFSQLGF